MLYGQAYVKLCLKKMSCIWIFINILCVISQLKYGSQSLCCWLFFKKKLVWALSLFWSAILFVLSLWDRTVETQQRQNHPHSALHLHHISPLEQLLALHLIFLKYWFLAWPGTLLFFHCNAHSAQNRTKHSKHKPPDLSLCLRTWSGISWFMLSWWDDYPGEHLNHVLTDH